VVRARKHLGQHFLHHRRILERIAEALAAPPGARILEIGPGQGGLTRVLAQRGARVTAIEKDRDLAARVAREIPEVRVVTGDALALDWHALMESPDPIAAASDWYLIGNIPYNITSPLIAKALIPPRPTRIVFLVQQEVADRLAAPPGSRTYGGLSVGVQALAAVEKLFRIPAGAFHPKPKVDSAVVRMIPRTDSLISDGDVAGFRTVVTGLFGFRRKQLLRGLRELTGWSPERVQRLLDQCGIPGTARPEVLAPESFARLTRLLIDEGGFYR
jgi:16S rRNA (adenine1518-N6/adenine1519-N6)-dimethyltransferase